jgi:hypothetical protein
MPRWISHLALAAAVAATAACNRAPKTSPSTAAPPKPVATLSADELVKQYQDNELGADAKYKNKLVEVTGKVGKVGKGLMGHPFVQLGTGQDEDLFGVTCYLTEKGVEQATKLQPGAAVTLRGTVMGKLGGQALRLQDCEIVNP